MRRGRTQDRVVLREDPVRLGIFLVARVALLSGFLCYLSLVRFVAAEVEVGPIARFVFKAFRVLDRSLQARVVTLEVAIATGRLLRSNTDEVFDDDSPITELAGLLPIGEAPGVDVDVVKLGKVGMAVIELVGGQGRADEHPLTITDRLLELAVGGKLNQTPFCFERLARGRCGRFGQREVHTDYRNQDHDKRNPNSSGPSKHGATSS